MSWSDPKPNAPPAAQGIPVALRFIVCLSSFFFNINYPNIPSNKIKGVKITKQGARAYGQKIIAKKDPRNNEYFWIGGDDLSYKAKKGTDIYAVRNGFISITPLIVNYTDKSSLKLKL